MDKKGRIKLIQTKWVPLLPPVPQKKTSLPSFPPSSFLKRSRGENQDRIPLEASNWEEREGISKSRTVDKLPWKLDKLLIEQLRSVVRASYLLAESGWWGGTEGDRSWKKEKLSSSLPPFFLPSPLIFPFILLPSSLPPFFPSDFSLHSSSLISPSFHRFFSFNFSNPSSFLLSFLFSVYLFSHVLLTPVSLPSFLLLFLSSVRLSLFSVQNQELESWQ